MNESIKKAMVFVLLILATGICQGGEQSADVGRDDPFAGTLGQVGSEPEPVVPVSEGLIPPKPQLHVQTVTLKFLKAANLKSALIKMSSDFGSIGVDDNTNSVIICDTKENLEKILAEVKKADQTPKQIMIEVVIVDVQLKDDTEIGVDWDLLTTDSRNVTYRQSMIYPNRLSIVAPDATTIGTTAAYQNVGLGSELLIANDDIRSVVNLLQEKRNVDILASPRVMVVSGQKANIKTIQEIPYQEVTQTSGGGGGSYAITSTQFKEVGVTLEVKAIVTEDEKILLTINPSQSVSTGTSIASVPVIDKREVSTTLLMDDGQVAVMGGLRRQETQKIKYQVPLLGDLPLIGFIFSNDRNMVENTELLVLLSPHVYKGEPVSADEMARFNQLKSKSLIAPPAESKSEASKQNQK
jgi:type II secretory pathway component GspD/PulD (secretin)